TWKVVLDLGIQLNEAVAPLNAPFQVAPQWKVHARSGDAEKDLTALLSADRAFFANAQNRSTMEAWKALLSDDARIHRNLMMPVVGKAGLQSWIAKQTAALSGEPLKADVARSGDFGYSYGKYELKAEKVEKGYYARVWKRDAKGDWRIVFDVTNPLPEETK
ncbi:MAG TPA: nuclear transport factor 2 family protein, partial [Blastocatellia bacterium]|nr:nuclear transport factor 2 family protein [Blastocatellia bacterium]